MQHVDVAIVGGGIVGLTLALALKDTPCTVAVINNGPLTTPVLDKPTARVSAINQSNINALEQTGAWQLIQHDRVNPYGEMHVWDKDSFGDIHFNASELAQESLGVIVENQALVNALAQRVEQLPNITVVNGKIDRVLPSPQQTMLMMSRGQGSDDEIVTCRLLVGADGANSYVRKQAGFPLTFKGYDHVAIVANVRTSRPHENVARQAFTPTGPLALLPMSDPHVCSIVWSQQSEKASDLMRLDDASFCNALYAASNGVLGEVSLETNRTDFPLTMRYARQWAKDGIAIIGDAAHTIHPLAGQGANLGMQDALCLASLITRLFEQQKDIGLHKHLREFERARKTEAVKMIAAMDGFAYLFDGSHPFKKLIRGVGLSATNSLPALKNAFVSQAMGL
ncbi:FAD-dependent monooxygenase [Alteromonas sp. KUL49]|uniref:FAD-dependent monooxygenase n=1 Tax=Alteromonas sp. KUL49 TaxID=2480798 RepID=UPI00102ED96C|nr:FAD-dependent monooxygenase [Alteromonas sp. KUL49]TAP41545.1 FAD-dependent 2-octaprenylphenol hydroxylase [Alteromonas sp. KUL49]GEA10641.1 2-octaprenyl-6-methoxyphenol hydroxylase [Alteromonas sp. KUL49]